MKTKKQRLLHKKNKYANKNKSNRSNLSKRTSIRKTKTTHMKSLRCSPNPQKKQNFSCYSDEALYKLRDLWNARHPDAKIDSNNTKEIWQFLSEHMKSVCNKESCWLKQNFVGEKQHKDLAESFAPESPKSWKLKPNEWLSSLDILKVMKQYEKAYKCFDFIGPSPIDYDTRKLYGECVWEELCNFNLQDEIKKGRFKIGIIFNMDPHYKGGSHWISMFINIKKRTIFYFDSAGEKIPPRIMKFANTVISQGNALNMNFKFDQNYPVEHQYGNTECGIYALFFIVHMLEDKITDHYLKTHILKDKYMQNFRKIYFNEDL